MSQETERLVAAAAASLCPDERYRQQAFDDARAATVAVIRELARTAPLIGDAPAPVAWTAVALNDLIDEIEEKA
ncbi:hypothetical protein [Prauserella endophytica]|uniref:Uncharacterized protein n=1 Tax=Prauserella endophytica TaxID=1592324 RepID=A0ABY2S0T2_9PSEU|nr:hypothetical protein [Prauserella endophytica]TKG67049.1 hypothetical protein FCN18_24395 [Prauserella endophytica]